MNTNVGKKDNSKITLANVSGEMKEEDKAAFEEFFSLGGTKDAFLKCHTQYTRRQLDYALDNGTIKYGMMTDIKNFIEENKDVVAAFNHAKQQRA